MEILGTGTYGSVLRVGNQAYKRYTYYSQERCLAQDFIFEVSLLRVLEKRYSTSNLQTLQFANPSLRGPFIHQVMNITITRSENGFYSKLYQHTLKSFLNEELLDGKLTPQYKVEMLRSLLYRLLTALRQIHDCLIIHGDIKPENILLDQISDCVLSDFGISVLEFFNRDDKTLDIQTTTYRAPEILFSDHNYTSKIDIWSVGIIALFVMTDGVFPDSFISPNNAETIIEIFKFLGYPSVEDWPKLTELSSYESLKSQIQQRSSRQEWQEILHKGRQSSEKIFSEDFYLNDLIIQMLTFNPDRRPTANELLRHEFFRPLNSISQNLPMSNFEKALNLPQLLPPTAIDEGKRSQLVDYFLRLNNSVKGDTASLFLSVQLLDYFLPSLVGLSSPRAIGLYGACNILGLLMTDNYERDFYREFYQAYFTSNKDIDRQIHAVCDNVREIFSSLGYQLYFQTPILFVNIVLDSIGFVDKEQVWEKLQPLLTGILMSNLYVEMSSYYPEIALTSLSVAGVSVAHHYFRILEQGRPPGVSRQVCEVLTSFFLSLV